jgi:hypothetical protein
MQEYRSDSSVVFAKDSIPNFADYTLCFTKIRGTYGGSSFCCRGEVFDGEVKSEVFLERSFFHAPNEASTELPIEQSFIVFKDRYIIEKRKYNEPLPTSGIHYIYEYRYFER